MHDSESDGRGRALEALGRRLARTVDVEPPSGAQDRVLARVRGRRSDPHVSARTTWLVAAGGLAVAATVFLVVMAVGMRGALPSPPSAGEDARYLAAGGDPLADDRVEGIDLAQAETLIGTRLSLPPAAGPVRKVVMPDNPKAGAMIRYASGLRVYVGTRRDLYVQKDQVRLLRPGIARVGGFEFLWIPSGNVTQGVERIIAEHPQVRWRDDRFGYIMFDPTDTLDLDDLRTLAASVTPQ